MSTMILALVAVAYAVEPEVALETGSHSLDDRNTSDLLGSASLGTPGARVGLCFGDHLAVIAGYQRSTRGAWDSFAGNDDGDLVAVGLAQQRATLGLRASLPVLQGYVAPFLSAQGTLDHANLKLDDAPRRTTNPGQLEVTALAPGLMTTLGVRVDAPLPDGLPELFVTGEGGYHWAGPLALGDLGALDASGAVVRFGVGARFP